MFYLPLYHNLKGTKCLVVGAGTTAVRKLRWLVRAEAEITVVSPEISQDIQALADDGKLVIHKQVFDEKYVSDDLSNDSDNC